MWEVSRSTGDRQGCRKLEQCRSNCRDGRERPPSPPIIQGRNEIAGYKLNWSDRSFANPLLISFRLDEMIAESTPWCPRQQQ